MICEALGRSGDAFLAPLLVPLVRFLELFLADDERDREDGLEEVEVGIASQFNTNR